MTAIDASVVAADGLYRRDGRRGLHNGEGCYRCTEAGREAVAAGDVLVLCCRGPLEQRPMEETYQVTSALKYLPWGKHVGADRCPVQPVSAPGACVATSPEALAAAHRQTARRRHHRNRIDA